GEEGATDARIGGVHEDPGARLQGGVVDHGPRGQRVDGEHGELLARDIRREGEEAGGRGELCFAPGPSADQDAVADPRLVDTRPNRGDDADTLEPANGRERGDD